MAVSDSVFKDRFPVSGGVNTSGFELSRQSFFRLTSSRATRAVPKLLFSFTASWEAQCTDPRRVVKTFSFAIWISFETPQTDRLARFEGAAESE